MNIKDKIAIVTGASSGIGFATAKLLSKKGAKVALVSRSENKLKEISKDLPHSFVFRTDMSKEEDIIRMVKEVEKHFGTINILVNNAGVGYDAPVENIDMKIFREVFDLDLAGLIVAMEQVIPIMRKNREGSIVNISSGTALMAIPNMAPYSSLKRALVGISLTAREELANDNIKVSVVYPYITETNFEKNTIKNDNQIPVNDQLMKGDSAEFVAQKILDAITYGEAEIFAHEWMKQR